MDAVAFCKSGAVRLDRRSGALGEKSGEEEDDDLSESLNKETSGTNRSSLSRIMVDRSLR